MDANCDSDFHYLTLPSPPASRLMALTGVLSSERADTTAILLDHLKLLMNSLITEEMISLTELSVRIEKEYKRERGGGQLSGHILEKTALNKVKDAIDRLQEQA